MRNAHDVIKDLALERRVLVLGGIAVIIHGLARATKDVDIWMEPGRDAAEWSSILRTFIERQDLTAARVNGVTGHFVSIDLSGVRAAVDEDDFVRLLGADRPIDVFRIPHNLQADDFDEVWQNGEPLEDGTRIPDEVDLILTKLHTGRAHDEADIRYLESKLEARYRQRLAGCSLREAGALLQRFSTPDIAAFAAAAATDPHVRELAEGYLKDMSLEGNAYATKLLGELPARRRGNQGPESS